MPLINCEIYFILAWSTNCVIVSANHANETFSITDTKLYVPVVTLSTQDNSKLLQSHMKTLEKLLQVKEMIIQQLFVKLSIHK